MSSPFVRKSAVIAAGAVVLGGLAVPFSAFAAEPAMDFASAVEITPDPDGAGQLYTLTADVRTFTSISLPDHATLDGNGHTITAVEDATHVNFPGSVIASAVGGDNGPAELDVKDLDITTEGFENGSNSGGSLNGIYMYRAGGSLTNVSVDGISHGNGVQEGNAISIRNRVSGDDINVPRAKVTLTDVQATNYQKTGILLDGNLSFTVQHATVGQGSGPQGQPNPITAANSLQISRGASGTVSDSSFALNSHAQATAVLLYNARKVDFDGVKVDGDAAATGGINISNVSNTIDTAFAMRGGEVTRTAAPAAGTGVVVDALAGSVTAKLTDVTIAGWETDTEGDVTQDTTPAVTKVDVTGTHSVSRPGERRIRVHLRAAKLGADQVEGKMLRWKIKVDGRRAAAIRQHAGETDVWIQKFQKGTGTHRVEILKNGVTAGTYKVHTR